MKKLTPVDLARDSKDSGSPELFDPAVVGRVRELTEERRWDALRGLAAGAKREGWSGRKEDPLPPGWAEIVFGLGLAEVEERTEGDEPVGREVLLAAVDHPDRRVRCPDCHVPPGAVCITVTPGRNQAYSRGHVARHRRAAE